MHIINTLLSTLLFPSRLKDNKRLQAKLETTLAGKTVLITGASYGIGEELAYLLALPTVHLILVARTAEKLDAVQQQVIQRGGTASTYALDLRNATQLDDFVAKLAQDNLHIDILVSNAGKSIKRPLFESLDRYHDYQRTMAINYFAPVQLCLALIPQLAKQQGHIINVSALNVLFPPMPEWGAYQASKSAFDQWFRSATPELASKHIATSTLYLPLVRTRMIAPTKAYNHAPAMTPEQVAGLIANMLITKRQTFKPWWAVFVEWSAFILRTPIAYVVKKFYRYISKK